VTLDGAARFSREFLAFEIRVIRDVFPEEEVGEEQKVGSPFAKRRKRQRELEQTIVEVLAEFAVSDHGNDVLIRSADDAGIEGNRFAATNASQLPFLQGAKQFGLKVQVQLADFVQEDGPPVSLLEFTDLAGMRSGERPFFVAEELAFHQVAWNSGTVHNNERSAFPTGCIMDGFGDQLFTRATLPLDSYGQIAACCFLDHAVDILHRR